MIEFIVSALNFMPQFTFSMQCRCFACVYTVRLQLIDSINDYRNNFSWHFLFFKCNETDLLTGFSGPKHLHVVCAVFDAGG